MIWDQAFPKGAIVTDGATGPRRVERPAVMDESTFEAFYKKTSRPLWVYIRRISGDAALADDILQEAYFRFLSIQLAAMDETQMKSYLYKIATNLINDHWRSQKREQKSTDESELLRPAPEHSTDLSQVLRELNSQQRSLLWLAYVEGNEHKEI